MEKRDVNSFIDGMFDFDGDGKIDMLEQIAEIDFLAGGQDDPIDADMTYDYMMHSKNPDIMLAAGMVGGADYEEDDEDYYNGYNDDFDDDEEDEDDDGTSDDFEDDE